MGEGRPEAAQMGQGALARLAGKRDGDAGFLASHHLEAGARLSLLFVRSRLAQRVTMSYDPTRIGTGGGNGQRQGDLADSAAEARQRLSALARQIPGDCWGVLIDICGFEKGLQQVETERGWPRRSAKLVLRIGLEQLALALGLDAEARGGASGAMRNWLPERPAMFADRDESDAAVN